MSSFVLACAWGLATIPQFKNDNICHFLHWFLCSQSYDHVLLWGVRSKKIYPYGSKGTPLPRHQLRRLFPVCTTVQYCGFRAVIQTESYSRQSIFYMDISSLGQIDKKQNTKSHDPVNLPCMSCLPPSQPNVMTHPPPPPGTEVMTLLNLRDCQVPTAIRYQLIYSTPSFRICTLKRGKILK